MKESKVAAEPIMIKDVEAVLQWAKANSRFYTLLASEMLEAIPMLCKGSDVLSETYLQTQSKVFTTMPVTFLGGLSSIIKGEMNSSRLKRTEYQSCKDTFIRLDQTINQR